MVRTCYVIGCNNRQNKDESIRFFRFPAVPNRFSQEYKNIIQRRRKAWLDALKRVDVNANDVTKDWRVCSAHFVSGEPADFRKIDHPDWVPSVRMRQDESISSRMSEICNDDKCEKKEVQSDLTAREVTDLQNQIIALQQELSARNDEVHQLRSEVTLVTALQQELTSCKDEVDPLRSEAIQIEALKQELSAHKDEVYRLKSENTALQQELVVRSDELYYLRSEVDRLNWNEKSFKGDDKKLKHYTGLPLS